MKFVQQDIIWNLVQETAEGPSGIISTLRSEVEVVVIAEFCKLILTASDRIPGHFPVSHKGVVHTATLLCSPGEKISLVVRGSTHSSTIATEFLLSAPVG